MIFLHCWKCRLISTPSGRRLWAFPKAHGTAIDGICVMAQAEQATQAARAAATTAPDYVFLGAPARDAPLTMEAARRHMRDLWSKTGAVS